MDGVVPPLGGSLVVTSFGDKLIHLVTRDWDRDLDSELDGKRAFELDDEEEVRPERGRRVPGKLSRLHELRSGGWHGSMGKPGAHSTVDGLAVFRKAVPGEIRADADEKIRAARAGAGFGLLDELESALGRSLGAGVADVRIHTGAEAAAAARAISANAFAIGKDVFFADGQYRPNDEGGRELIAHEVAHAVSAPSSAGAAAISSPTDSHEQQADRFAAAFTRGEHRVARDAAKDLSTAAAGVVHRQEEAASAKGDGEEKSHEDQLREIQAQQMSSLLGSIAALPAEVQTDYAAAHVGGPRLKAAMHAVAHGGDWASYIDQYHGEAGHLPADQLEAIMKHLGGPPKDYGYFKDVGSFDGSLDAGSKLITLYFRVKFVVPEDGGAEFPGSPGPGKPGWQESINKGLIKYGADFKREIEAQWSGKGRIKSAVKALGTFNTKVEVAVVNVGQHSTITVVTSTRSGHAQGGKTGTFSSSDNKKLDKTTHTLPGRKDDPVKSKQTTSAHEFGHAIGVPHVDDYDELRKQYMAEKDPKKKKELAEQLRAFMTPDGKHRQELEYGNTEEEVNHMMGAGDQLKVIHGADPFDPFVPFQKIAEAWGAQHIKAQTLNKWSSE